MIKFDRATEKLSACKSIAEDACGKLSRLPSDFAECWVDVVGAEAAHKLSDISGRWSNDVNELLNSMENALSLMKSLVAEVNKLGSATDSSIGNLHGLKAGY